MGRNREDNYRRRGGIAFGTALNENDLCLT